MIINVLGRAIACLTAAVLLISAMSIPASATTEAEHNGCQGYSSDANTGLNYLQSVKHGGSLYPGIAKMRIYVKDTDNGQRYCTIGYNQTDDKLRMKLMICTREEGKKSNPLTCAPKNSEYTDKGRFNDYAGGVALTPSSGRCAAVKLVVHKKGTKYKRVMKMNEGLCN